MTPGEPSPMIQALEEFVICLAQALDDLDHAAPEDRSSSLAVDLLLNRAIQAIQGRHAGNQGAAVYRLAQAVEQNLDQLRNSRQ